MATAITHPRPAGGTAPLPLIGFFTLKAIIAMVGNLVLAPIALTVQRLERAGVVAVIRLAEGAALRAVADALAEGGVRALEVTMTVPRAAALIEELAKALPDEFLVGAGTVLDANTAREVIDAGARFVVSPVFRRPVLEAVHAGDIAALPGCFTPTEIMDAWDGGADIVKVFPATE